MVTDKRIAARFVALTFCIAYGVSGILIALGPLGYSVHNWVHSPQQLVMNAPFAIYILSPAIASYVVLRRSGEVASFREWLKVVFYVKNRASLYVFVVAGLALYFSAHFVVSGPTGSVLPFYVFFLSLPGNLIIGGLEEAGWMYALQPRLDKSWGFVLSSLAVGAIWVLWHIPLFFIPGTNHSGGLIDFWMFSVQVMAFRFLYGAVYRISGKGGVFMCVLCHTMFNAASFAFGIPPTTWAGTITANAAVVLFSIATVAISARRGKPTA